MKRIVGILVLLISVLSVYAQSANIEEIWIDHNAYEKNQSGMRIHVKFDVNGLKNQKIYVSASFFDEKKENRIKCYSDGYKTSSNTMVSYCYSTPSYENSTYNDFQLFMPYYVFDNSNMQSGTYTFYISVSIVSNWKQIATSNWQFFTYTRRNNNIANGNTNRFSNGRVTGEKWTEYHNNAEFSMEQKSDGSVKSGMVTDCWRCHGTRKCVLCHGQGGSNVYSYGRYVYLQCNSCFGKGVCSYCGGQGKNIQLWDVVYPKANFPCDVTPPGCYTWYDNYWAGVGCNPRVNAEQTAFKKGNELFKEGRYSEAIGYFENLASKGIAEAQFNIGLCYYNLNNFFKAVEWWQQAASQGDADAQCDLGVCYQFGKGVSQNYYKAFEWYQKSANQGNTEGLFRLGACYYQGYGVSKNISKAKECFQKASNNGHAKATFMLNSI